MARPIWLLLLAVGAVVYGSLYPFEFVRTPSDGVLAALTASLRRPAGRADLIANVVLYIPVGLFWAMSFPRGEIGLRIVLGIAFGAAMSTGLEIAQAFDRPRTPSLYDVGMNTVGAAVGSMVGYLVADDDRGGQTLRLRETAAALIGVCWPAYLLYPYVPQFGYWSVVEAYRLLPVTVDLPIFGVTRHATAWLTFASLAAAVVGGRGLLPLIMVGGGVLVGEPLIAGIAPPPYAIAGLAAALLLCWPLARRRVLLGLAMLAVVIVGALEPFRFSAPPGPFHLQPFVGFVGGSIAVAVQAMLLKAFMYGSTIWLLHRGGWRLPKATIAVASALLATEVAQTLLPQRVAEITDPLIAVLCACVIALLPTAHHKAKPAS